MKSWKNRWKSELNTALPPLSEDVKNAPIPKAENVDGKEKKSFDSFLSRLADWWKTLFVNRPRAVACVAACLACVMLLCVVLPVALHKPSDGVAEVIAVEINPKALFSVDKKGKITAVIAGNTDADVILADERRTQEIEGKSVEEGVKIFVDYAARLGYLDLTADPSAPEVMRISACTEKGRLSSVQKTLGAYFREKGAYVAVAEDYTTAEELSGRMGLETVSDVSSLLTAMGNLPGLYSQRIAEGKDVTELQTIYRESVPLEDVRDDFKKALEENVRKIEQNMADLEALAEQNQVIYRHKDNPIWLIGADYWTLQYCHKESEYTDVFRAEIEKMDALLAEYEETYGVKINSYVDLDEAIEDCELLPLDTLTEILLNFTLDVFTRYFSELVGLLENIGLDMSGITAIYELPNTAAEYVNKTQAFVKSRYETLTQANKERYEEVRAAITQSDYDRCLADVLENYGSLSAYWESLAENS